MVPKTVEIKDMLFITWDDGHETVLPFRYLRGNCPCASCINEITGKRMVKEEDISPNVRMEDTDKVGNYALAFLWSDGHFSGIYPFDYLRKLCRCEKCSSGKP